MATSSLQGRCVVGMFLSSSFTSLKLYLESTSRNRILKTNSRYISNDVFKDSSWEVGGYNAHFRFLYQVFPGTSAQCKRQLLRAARIGELDTVKKLVGDTETAQVLCNTVEPPITDPPNSGPPPNNGPGWMYRPLFL